MRVGSTLMRDGLEKSAHKFYAERANPTCFLRAKCGTNLYGAGQPALPPLFIPVQHAFSTFHPKRVQPCIYT